ncbi:hypothetical protein NBRC116583_14240 [Arenicella sp. 4NH20-0111]
MFLRPLRTTQTYMTSKAPAHALPETPDWNSIVAEDIVEDPELINSTTARIRTGSGTFYLQVSSHGVRMFSHKQRDYDYGLLVADFDLLDLNLDIESEKFTISSDLYRIHVGSKPLTLTVEQVTTGDTLLKTASDGHFVRTHRVPPLAKTQDGWMLSLSLSSNEPVYGLGEKWGALNKRGQLIRSYNSDALGVNAELSYKNIPFCWSPEGWGMFVHTPAVVTHSVGHPSWSQRSYCCLIEDEIFDVFLLLKPKSITENVGAEMISALTQLTGRAPLPPAWSGGVILSKAYYQDPDELLKVAREVRSKNMPCDTITIDGRAWQDTDTRFAFEWDDSRWPDPKKVMDELKQLNFKVCIWEYPLISVNHSWFSEFAEKGWLIKDIRTDQAYLYDWDQQAFGEVLTTLPQSGIVDFTHPDAYAFWRDAHKDLFDIGIDMIKADFGEQLEDDNMIASNGERGLALHNVYAHLYNRCVYEAAELYSKSGPFLFSRSSWIGCQRFNSQWGGDPQADWEGMMGNVRGGLSWGLSGAPFYATDIGGFYKDTRDDALYVRWAQAAVFSAHFRLHGIGAREPWSYSSEAESAVFGALELRYRLQTYLQKTMIEATVTGMPVQRPMVIAFPDEKQAWGFENQFMFGADILVAPCFNPSGQVEYYLPKGRWSRLDLASSEPEVLLGSQVYTEVLELDGMAVFVREGVSLPINKAVLSTDELSHGSDGELLHDSVWLA